MARSSGGRSASRPASRSTPARNTPQTVKQAPPPAPVQGGSGESIVGGIGSTIAQGLAFGTGSEMAHRAVDSIMGPRTVQHETVASEAAAAPMPTTNNLGGSDGCSNHYKALQDLWKRYQQVPVLHGFVVRMQEELRLYDECLSAIDHALDGS